jgi:hypothetical protein
VQRLRDEGERVKHSVVHRAPCSRCVVSASKRLSGWLGDRTIRAREYCWRGFGNTRCRAGQGATGHFLFVPRMAGDSVCGLLHDTSFSGPTRHTGSTICYGKGNEDQWTSHAVDRMGLILLGGSPAKQTTKEVGINNKGHKLWHLASLIRTKNVAVIDRKNAVRIRYANPFCSLEADSDRGKFATLTWRF